MTPELLKQIIADQQEEKQPAVQVERTAEKKLAEFAQNQEIIVLTGVRRCGKSVLLQQTRLKNQPSNYYFNFEDERLLHFTVNDFHLLQEVFIELFGIENTYYFDEIQNIEHWELFVRRLYNNGNKIYITGSNATLFSEELGTRLTGRYISYSIYPYSFLEFVNFKNSQLLEKKLLSTTQTGQIYKLFSEYCQLGGIPEYVKYQQTDYLHSLYESILYRDIMARYKIQSTKILKELVFYLASNCSKEFTYNSLKKLLGLGSSTTVSDYCSYLENSYLCFFINRYSESVKVQMQSPKKVYFIDHVLAKIIGFRFSEDKGRMLENLVFLEIKRRGYSVYYHKEMKECDFLLRENGKILSAIQVCQQLENPKTRQREIDGLIEAMERYSLEEGFILTERENSIINHGQHTIKIMPIWKWLLAI